jgi:hypothetical protein
MDFKGSGSGLLHILHQPLLGGIHKTTKNFHSDSPISCPRFEQKHDSLGRMNRPLLFDKTRVAEKMKKIAERKDGLTDSNAIS